MHIPQIECQIADQLETEYMEDEMLDASQKSHPATEIQMVLSDDPYSPTLMTKMDSSEGPLPSNESRFDQLNEQIELKTTRMTEDAKTQALGQQQDVAQYRSTVVQRINPQGETRPSSQSVAMSTTEKLRQRVMSGKPLDYRCSISIPGVVYSSISTRRLSIDLSGRIQIVEIDPCLLYTSPSPRDRTRSRMPSSA